MNTTIGTAVQSLVLTSNATLSAQNYYFTRFVSPALSGVTSITAQTWTYNFATTASSSSANFATSVQATVRATAYVWRPGTQTKVGNILDGNTTGLVNEGSANNRWSHNASFTGSLVSSVSDGDVICFEVWFVITQAAATAYTDTFWFDGTTVNAGEGNIVTDHASFIETPQTVTFAGAGTPVDCTVTGKTIYNKTTTHG